MANWRKRHGERVDIERSEALGEQVIDNIESDPRHKYDELAAYMSRLVQYRIPKQEEFDLLFDQYRNGATDRAKLEARDLLVYKNVRLVLSIALRHSGHGLSLLDMLQEGVIGMMTAIDHFDPALGIKFSTYAFQWIRQAITRALADGGEDAVYRLPVHKHEQVLLVKRAIATMMRTEGRWPSQLEIFEFIKALDTKVAADVRMSDVVECHAIVCQGSSSLDQSASSSDGEDGGRTFGEVCGAAPDIETVVEARRLLAQYKAALARIEDAVAALSPREAMVLRLRFGLGDFEAMTLEAISERYDITRERIRQIESGVLEAIEASLGVSTGQLIEIVRVTEELEAIVAAAGATEESH